MNQRAGGDSIPPFRQAPYKIVGVESIEGRYRKRCGGIRDGGSVQPRTASPRSQRALAEHRVEECAAERYCNQHLLLEQQAPAISKRQWMAEGWQCPSRSFAGIGAGSRAEVATRRQDLGDRPQESGLPARKAEKLVTVKSKPSRRARRACTSRTQQRLCNTSRRAAPDSRAAAD